MRRIADMTDAEFDATDPSELLESLWESEQTMTPERKQEIIEAAVKAAQLAASITSRDTLLEVRAMVRSKTSADERDALLALLHVTPATSEIVSRMAQAELAAAIHFPEGQRRH
jgi:hypothetical protein